MLVELLTGIGARIVEKEILADDLDPLADKLREYADRPDVNLVVTTGGTGFGPRDNTPEATLRVIERAAPGLSEAMRIQTLKNTPMAMLRGVSVWLSALIIIFPVRQKAVLRLRIIKPGLSQHLLARWRRDRLSAGSAGIFPALEFDAERSATALWIYR